MRKNQKQFTRQAGAALMAASFLVSCQSPHSATDSLPNASAAPPTLATGTVIFERLEPAQLEDFRIIPETGPALFTPENSTYVGVDGFWWRQRRGEWFKIPGGTLVRIFPQAGAGSPLAFDLQSTPTAEFYFRWKGPKAAPGWQRDSGVSAHPTNDPF